MKLLSVKCNDCGAPLEVAESTRFVTCNHCGSQLAVQRTASSVFTEKLEQLSQKTDQIAGNLEVIRLQNELERIDREWAMERESLLVRGKEGQVHEPSGSSSLVGAFVAIMVGTGWMIFTSRMGAPAIFPLFGLVFIIAGVAGAFSGHSRANRFNAARSRHETARQELLKQLGDLRGRNQG